MGRIPKSRAEVKSHSDVVIGDKTLAVVTYNLPKQQACKIKFLLCGRKIRYKIFINSCYYS